MSSGEFVDMVADDPQEKIKLKMFHSQIIHDLESANKGMESFKPIPTVETVNQYQVIDKFFQINMMFIH
ncbi:MAG: hypothetical protein K2Q21_08985 [Chitinophagaceae bacterium]|nr:hypothetical protein [Chitinophagaceae bacterium]